MNWKRSLDPQGLNWWIIASGIGTNLAMTWLLYFAVAFAIARGASELVYALSMSVGGFLIPMITAYVCGRIGGERFLAYALYPLAGYLVLVVPGIRVAGPFGLLMAGFGIMGAFNGSFLLSRRAWKRRNER